MLLKANRCPICESPVSAEDRQCPECGCVIQLTLDGPWFDRCQLVAGRVQPAVDAWRDELVRHPHSALTRYRVGLGYLNYQLPAQGIAEWRQAVGRLGERHVARFELALVAWAAGEYTLGGDQIQRALELAPTEPTYWYLADLLRAGAADQAQQPQGAVESWLAAYARLPGAPQARQALEAFVAQHEHLLGGLSPEAPGLGPRERAYLALWATNPTQLPLGLPPAPTPPAPLGRRRLGLLRRFAPARAAQMEQLYAARVAQYQTVQTAYQTQEQAAQAERAAELTAWQAQVEGLHNDLPVMARLCLAAVEEEARQRAEAARIQAARAAQRTAQHTPGAARPTPVPRARQARTRNTRSPR